MLEHHVRASHGYEPPASSKSAIAALRPAGWLVKTTSGKLSRADNLAKYLNDPEADHAA